MADHYHALLSEYCLSVTDGDHQAPPKADQGVPFITISAMNDGSLELAKATRFVPRHYYDGLHPARRAQCGDILYSVTGSFGIPALVEDHRPFVFQRHIALIRPQPEICDSRWLAYMLASSSVFEQSSAIATGTAQLTVPLTGLRNLELPVVGLAKQHRTVAKLDSLTARVARARAELDRVPVLAKRLRESSVTAAFSGWARQPLGEVSRDITYGYTASAQPNGTGSKFLRITDIHDRAVDWSTVPYVQPSPKDIGRCGLKTGDIVFARSGATVGKSLLVVDPPADAVFASYLIRVRVNVDVINPKVAAYYFQSSEYWAQIVAGATGTGQPNFNGSKLAELLVPVGTMEQQREAIKVAETAFARADRLEAEAARARALLDRLESALLAKAFRGELVPQDPSDEPAQSLLERIRTQRASAPKAKRGRRMNGNN